MYDANAVAVVESIGRTVQRLHPDRQGEIIAILNAIESHVEEGQGDPIVRLDARAVTVITQKLVTLRDRIGRSRG
jgi:hypothetical protein